MTAALERVEWSAARPGSTSPPVKTRYPFYRRLVGPQGRSERTENLAPHWDSIRDRPSRSQSLYRLSYPAHTWYYCTRLKFEKKLLLFGKWLCTHPKGKVMEGHADLGPKERTFCHRTSSSLFCMTPWLYPPWIYFFSWLIGQNSTIENYSTASNLWLISSWQKGPKDYGIFNWLLGENKCSGMNVTVQVAGYFMYQAFFFFKLICIPV